MSAIPDPRRIVSAGYDYAGRAYAAARPSDPEAPELLGRLLADLPERARVLDAGCGAGVPVARALAARHEVLGVDISPVQVALAGENVPEATFQTGDISALDLADASVEAVVSYYAVIHVPREDHERTLADFHRVLVPGGLLLVCMGNGDNPGAVEDGFFGTTMYWSHFDGPANLAMVRRSGFEVLGHEEVPDPMGDGSHLFVLARSV